MDKLKEIPINKINMDTSTQPREQINFIVVADYAEQYRTGAIMPAIEVVTDGEVYWLWDGWHRTKGAEQAGKETIMANVQAGDLATAQWLSYSANQTHGLRRSNADKRRAVELALSHPKAVTLSDQQLSNHCGVARSNVWNIRKEMESTCQIDKSATRTGRDGRTINTANIGKSSTDKLAPEAVTALQSSLVADSPEEVERVAKLPAEAQVEAIRTVDAGEAKTVKEFESELKREAQTEKINVIAEGNTAMPEVGRRFPVIYADPPWRYEHSRTTSRDIENQYPTMTLREICDLPIADIAADGSVLFLWATSPKLLESFSVIESWGFEYRTCMVWVKDKIGMGYYARQQHELLLIAKRGDIPAPLPQNRPASVIEAPREEHSKKPECVYGLIEAMYPEYSKIELFARRPRGGWHTWGNQV